MRILIAEDSQTQAVDLRRRLEALGHEVVVTSSGLEAWNHLRTRPETLVISDWMMPEMSGLELCRKIRGENGSPYVYLILLTAKNHRHERLQGLSAGADDFMAKPIDSCELEIALKTARRIIAAHEALRSRARDLESANQELVRLATLDELTGLKNRRGFAETLAAVYQQALQDRLPLSLLRVEFPSDEPPLPRAPAETEERLIRVAQRLLSVCRDCDTAARVSERGFALILPGLSAEGTLATADRLRAALLETACTGDPAMTSLGVATMTAGDPLGSERELLERCESSLSGQVSALSGWVVSPGR